MEALACGLDRTARLLLPPQHASPRGRGAAQASTTPAAIATSPRPTR